MGSRGCKPPLAGGLGAEPPSEDAIQRKFIEVDRRLFKINLKFIENLSKTCRNYYFDTTLAKYDSLRFYDMTPNSYSRYVEISCRNFANVLHMFPCVGAMCPIFAIRSSSSYMSGLPSLAEALGFQLQNFDRAATIEIHAVRGSGWSDRPGQEQQYKPQSDMIDEAMDVPEAPRSEHTSSIISRVQAYQQLKGLQNEQIFLKQKNKKRGVHMLLKYQQCLVASLHEDIEHIKDVDVVVTYLGGYNASGSKILQHEQRCLEELLQCQSSLLLPGYTGCLLLGRGANMTPFSTLLCLSGGGSTSN